jgi:hypothetical protein
MISNASPEGLLRIGLDEEGVPCYHSAVKRTKRDDAFENLWTRSDVFIKNVWVARLNKLTTLINQDFEIYTYCYRYTHETTFSVGPSKRKDNGFQSIKKQGKDLG